MTLRIGQGYDIHKFKGGNPCIIGGINIPHPFGPMGHSDADPLLHAIIDALLGAAGLGDIGEHFPDTDQRWKGADSSEMLAHVVGLLQDEGYSVVNVDSSVITQGPRLSPYKEEIESHIAMILGVDDSCVNVKGKTNEKMDAVGRGEAIASQAVVLIQKA